MLSIFLTGACQAAGGGGGGGFPNQIHFSRERLLDPARGSVLHVSQNTVARSFYIMHKINGLTPNHDQGSMINPSPSYQIWPDPSLSNMEIRNKMTRKAILVLHSEHCLP
jgi:hypothetical protein